MRDGSPFPCNTLNKGKVRLVLIRQPDGSEIYMEVPNTCDRPAVVAGPDGVMRCKQHDRIIRGTYHGAAGWKGQES